MEIYLVGGAVRDELLDFPVRERDWVVVGSTVDELINKGFKQVGKDFPVFLHPDTHEEYALARTERKTAAGYKGFTVHADISVTLEQDLARRDLTINAIAKSDDGEFFDPFNGIIDIKNRLIRHVSPAFAEDPVRILRIARFMAKYFHLGFSIAKETLDLMKSMVTTGEVDALVPERIWTELSKALDERSPHIFIHTLRQCNALKIIAPELDSLFSIPQRADFHPEIDCGVHSLLSLEQACIITPDKQVRFAALVHDLGKATTPQEILPKHIKHEVNGVPQLKSLCKRLHCPNDYRDLALRTCEFHTQAHSAFELRPKSLLKLFQSIDAFRNPQRFEQFLLACEADSKGRTGFENCDYPQKKYLAEILAAANEIDTKQFAKSDLIGKEIAKKIRELRLQAISSAKEELCPPGS